MNRTAMRGLIRSLLRTALALAALAAPASAQRQGSNEAGTPASAKAGTAGASSYAQDKIETVNVANGNISINIPLVTVGGRGSASYTVALTYNAKVWSSGVDTDPGYTDPFGNYTPPFNHYYAVYDDQKNPERGIGGGWRLETAPRLKARVVNIDPLPREACSDRLKVEDGPPCGYKYILTRMWLLLPDGSEVELRDGLTEGAPALTPADPDTRYHRQIDRDRGRVWHSTDGSNVTLVLDSSRSLNVSDSYVSAYGWVFLADGTRMRMEGSILDGTRATKIIDPNGNYLLIQSSETGAGYTDQLGRQVSVGKVEGGIAVAVKGYGGVPDRVVNIDFGLIGEDANLRAEYRDRSRWPRPFITGDYVRTRDQADREHSLDTPHTDLFALSEGMRYDDYDVGRRSVVTGVRLLDGRSFRFRYNPWGEVAEIVYPGGGVSQIDYERQGLGTCGPASPLGAVGERGVSARRSLTDGAHVDVTWEYPLVTAAAATLEAYRGEHQRGSGAGELLLSETHYFMAVGAEFTQCREDGPNGTGYEKWENAKEYKVETRTGTGTVTTVRQWAQRAPVTWGNDVGLSYNAYAAQYGGPQQSANDPRVLWEETTLESGKKGRVEYDYDQFNNVTATREYDFGDTTGGRGDLLRQTRRTYLTSLNGYCYTNLNGLDGQCGGGLSADLNAIIHQRRRLLTETVKDGAGNVEAFTKYDYDNYPETVFDPAAQSPIETNDGMIQYDGARFSPFSPSTPPRGNVTKASVWIEGGTYTENPAPAFSGGTFAAGYSHYDNAGNVVATKDPLGRVSRVSYADNFGDGANPDAGSAGAAGPTFALPTLTTNPLGHQSKVQYEFALGAAAGAKDADGVRSRTEYDALGRPVRATSAAGLAEQSVSELSYPTAAENVSRASRQLDATHWLASKTVFDGFGRPVLSATSEDGRHASAADFTVFTTTVYDALGRVKMATNPYRAEAASTDGWVRNTYDLAGRLTEAATFAGGVSAPPPDAGTNRNWTGSIVKTYGGDVTTVRDQANKQRRSTTDGLGRLKSVDEMLEYPSTTVYATTGYAYDARGNLKIVSQGRQTRTFAYDGLSRLKSATNPEVCAQQATGGCSPVPVTFAYDAASNLKSKTDARGVITSYDYDALNRPVTRSYSAPAGLPSTPAVTYAYDTAPNGTGRLASVTSSVSAYSYDSYDAIGRVKSSTQTTDGQRYRMSYAYDLAGNLTSEKYPSGRTVTSTIDPAGRLDNVSSGQSPCAAGGAGTCYASSLTYAASGAVLGVTLGNGLRERTAFNNRLQPTEIGIRNVATNSDLLKLDYAYETLDANNNSLGDNNGNLRSQTITVPGLAAPLVQSYQYDHLNRLKSAEELKGAASQWKQVYSYDRYGNRRLAVGTTFPALTGNLNDPVHNPQIDEATNRLLEDQNDDGQRDYVYDAAGNVVRDALGRTFSYDADNMQVTFNGGPDINTGGASYSYDAAGRRVKKVTLAGTTVFVYDAAGKLVAEYSNEAPQPGEGGTKYLTEDNLGSPRVVTDKDGRVVSRHDYAPFGEDLGEKLPASRTAEYKQDSVRQQFTGQEHDRDSGLDYFNARYYSSTQGRFTSIDPLAASGQAGNPQSWNRYAYVLNNPLKFIDSTGMVPVQADSTKAKNGPGVVILFPVRRVEIVGRTPDGKAEIGKIVTDYVKAGDNIQKAANALYDHYVDRRLEVQANLEKAGRDADRIANGSSPMPKTQAFIDDLFKSAATGKESTGNLEKAFDKEKDNTPTVNVGIGGDVNERDFKAEMEVTKVFAAEGIEEKHIPDTLEAIKKAAINQADNLIDARRGRKPPQ